MLNKFILKSGFFLRLIGKHKLAEVIARKLIAKNNKNAYAWRLLGLELADKSENNPAFELEAEGAFCNAYKCLPSNYLIVYNFCCYLGWLGKLSEAYEILNAYAKINQEKANQIKTIIESYEKGNSRGVILKNQSCDCEDMIPDDLNLKLAYAEECFSCGEIDKAFFIWEELYQTLQDKQLLDNIKKRIDQACVGRDQPLKKK